MTTRVTGRNYLIAAVAGLVIVAAAVVVYLLVAQPDALAVSDVKPKTSSSEVKSTPTFKVLMALSFAALVMSIWVNVFLLKWRRAVSAGDMSIVPSELLDISNKQTRAIVHSGKTQGAALNGLVDNISKVFSGIRQGIDSTEESSRQMLEAFTSLQSSLTAKDAEIQRLRTGYDAEIYRRFLGRFLRLDRTINEEIEDAGDENPELLQVLEEVRVLLTEAFLECGLEQYAPEVGENIRETDGVDESYKTVLAGEDDELLTIAKIVENGWRLNTPSGFDFIKKARVAVFVEAPAAQELEE